MFKKFAIVILATLCLAPVASAQIFKQPFRRNFRPQYQPPRYQRYQNSPANRYTTPGNTLGRAANGQQRVIQQAPPITPQQRLEFQRKQKRRAELAQRRQREMERQGQSKTIFPRMVGEFEKQKAILLSICDWQSQHYPILKEMVEKTAGHANLVVLYNNEKQLREAVALIAKGGKQNTHVGFLQLELNTIWLRDFGPRIAEKQDGTSMSMDFYYDGSRPKDDDFPEKWSSLTRSEFNHVPWTLQGGNLISNGKGLAIASNRIFKDNKVQFSSSRGVNPVVEQQNFVIRQFKLFCNIKELVLLRPLDNESTQHVDMFSTFLAPDLILMARVDRRMDPVNAEILDWNARRMAQVKVDGKPMRVERISVPARKGKYWSPYTNIILTDQLVLLPTFKTDPPAYVKQAVDVYRRLLPNHHVATIDMSSMSKLEGSLHCLSCNVPEFAELPTGITPYRDVLAGRGIAQSLTDANNRRVDSENSAQNSVLLADAPNDEPAIAQPPVASPRQANIASSASPSNGPVQTDSKPNSKPEAESSELSEYDRRIQKAREAVKTYRRNFRTETGDQQIDAYVVAVRGQMVTLLRAQTKEQVEVRINFLKPSDRNWLNKNRSQINKNGERVLDFLLNFEK